MGSVRGYHADVADVRKMTMADIPKLTRYEKVRLRFKARQELKRLCIEQDWKCHYCQVGLTLKGRHRDLLRQLPPLGSNRERRSIVIDGIRIYFATIDHVVPIALGGRNENNIVAACQKCNDRLDRARQKANAKAYWASQTEPLICRNCGKPRTKRSKNHCNECDRQLQRLHMPDIDIMHALGIG